MAQIITEVHKKPLQTAYALAGGLSICILPQIPYFCQKTGGRDIDLQGPLMILQKLMGAFPNYQINKMHITI